MLCSLIDRSGTSLIGRASERFSLKIILIPNIERMMKMRMMKIDCLISHPHFSICKSVRLVPRLASAARTVLIGVTKGQTCLREAATDRQAAVMATASLAQTGSTSGLVGQLVTFRGYKLYRLAGLLRPSRSWSAEELVW